MTGRRIDWRAEMPASLEAVDEYCERFRIWQTQFGGELNAFEVELLLRELLNNAVIHGSAHDAAKRVFCHLRLKPGRLLMTVRDEGPGFDWALCRRRSPDCVKTCGRGFAILQYYARAVRFNRQGNAITLIKNFNSSEEGTTE